MKNGIEKRKADFIVCINDTCSLKKKCLRHQSNVIEEGRVSYSFYKPEKEKCDKQMIKENKK